jgi:hypothetical protein
MSNDNASPSVAAALARIEQKVDSLDERLFNGGAGVISVLQADIDGHTKKIDANSERITKLDGRWKWATGFAAAIQLILAAILGIHIGNH